MLMVPIAVAATTATAKRVRAVRNIGTPLWTRRRRLRQQRHRHGGHREAVQRFLELFQKTLDRPHYLVSRPSSADEARMPATAQPSRTSRSTGTRAWVPTRSPRSASTSYERGLNRLRARSQAGMIATGYSALEAKNSGIMIACPMPISRSRDSTSPAIVIDRQEKNAEP